QRLVAGAIEGDFAGVGPGGHVGEVDGGKGVGVGGLLLADLHVREVDEELAEVLDLDGIAPLGGGDPVFAVAAELDGFGAHAEHDTLDIIDGAAKAGHHQFLRGGGGGFAVGLLDGEDRRHGEQGGDERCYDQGFCVHGNCVSVDCLYTG